MISNRPSLISSGNLKFVVMDAPSDENAATYADNLERLGVAHLVRTCEGMYDDRIFESKGIKIHVSHRQEFKFTDGSSPPKAVVLRWLSLVKNTFFEKRKLKPLQEKPPCIAIHCLAGLGRAPVLVAIALIEAGMNPNGAVGLIRKHRHGALNYYQVKFLNSYKKVGAYQHSCCVLL
ncbi:unnamed protein product [Blepharisma stoltei]|uniref:protein-tyrosine-phosphatase n=1 Tax=Blepharisma stoltei TaxID=1481888 RepID=A0AAU9JX01_9CILI|nr:unnamed protein product [Blepharisma stoltei]